MRLSDVRAHIYKTVRSTVCASLAHMFQRKKSHPKDEDSLWRIKRWSLSHLEPHYIGRASTRTYRHGKFRYRCRQKSRRYRRTYGELINQMLRDEILLTELISEVATNISLTALGAERPE